MVGFFGGWQKVSQPDYDRSGNSLEKLRSSIPIPAFLPYFDPQQNMGETEVMRLAYRRMLADPIIKSAFLPKIFGVGSLDLQLHPASKKKRDLEISDHVHWQLTRRLKGGMPNLAYTLLVHGGVDGYCIGEPCWGLQKGGMYDGKEILRDIKPKDVDNDLVIHIDEFKNVDAILGLRYNAGLRFDPKDFLIYTNLPFFGNPTGTSDFRAAYANWWRLDTVWKLRMMGAERRALPIVTGEYQEVTQQNQLQNALARIKWSNWLAVPKDTKVQAIDMAGQSDQIFSSFRRDVVEEIFLCLQYAYLNAIAGQQGQHRGSSKIGESRSELAIWAMSTGLQQLLNDEENGLIKQIVDRNYIGVSEYPLATLSGVDDEDLVFSSQVDSALAQMGWKHDIPGMEARYARKYARDKDDILEVPVEPQPAKMSDELKRFSESITNRINSQPSITIKAPAPLRTKKKIVRDQTGRRIEEVIEDHEYEDQ